MEKPLAGRIFYKQANTKVNVQTYSVKCTHTAKTEERNKSFNTEL